MKNYVKTFLKNSPLFFAGFMLLVAANSVAMTLGRHRSATLIGQPLEMSVQAVLDVQEDVSALCLDADVFYADSKVSKSRVRVTAERAAPGSQDVVIRIRSSSLIDEPVVIVYLRVGCQQKLERRYVALADLPSDVVPDRNVASFGAQPIQVSPPSVSASTALAPLAGLNPAKSSVGSVNDPSQISSQKSRKPKKPAEGSGASATAQMAPANPDSVATAPMPASQKAERAQTAAKAASANRPRLKLEPFDLSVDRDPRLKSSTELLSSPAAGEQERTAAAALWRAIAAQPQDVLKEFEKLQSLENSVRSLQAQNQKTQQSINELEVKLQKTASERYSNALVYALCCLLLLALAGLAFLMRERFIQRRLSGADSPWWRRADSQNNPRSPWAGDGTLDKNLGDSRQPTAPKREPVLPQGAKLSKTELDLNLADVAEPLAPASDGSDFALSMTLPARAVKAEELFDVQQQADFFVSIGQHDQAIEVLRAHIADSVETSALVYLDLFNLYHQLRLKDDYAVLREQFNDRFNTKIPVFEMYSDAGPGLEAYQTAMSRIEALWPSSKVLDLIEESIFKRPETNAEAFNLEAYRELLMLYSVAKEISRPEPKNLSKSHRFDFAETGATTSGFRRPDFKPTSIQPLSASLGDEYELHPNAELQPVLLSSVPPASLHLGLDLDLSEPAPAVPAGMATDVLDVSDAEFFAPFDKDADSTLPLPGVKVAASKSPENTGNMIDFNAFDAAAGDKKKTRPR